MLMQNNFRQNKDKHHKNGYILFLLFSILSLCSVLVSLYFSRVIIYRQLMQLTANKQQCQQLAISCADLGQSLLTTIKEEKKENTQTKFDQESEEQSLTPDQKILIKIFPYLNKEKSFNLTKDKDIIDATISLSIICEQGKLNLNSLWDFEKKKFINEGKPNDAKKLCSWLFGRIAQITGKQNLFSAFENILKNRTCEFNDPIELLADSSFAEQFNNSAFVTFEKNSTHKIFLTDIFTVYTEEETISPWLFSPSWQQLLDIKTKENLNQEEIIKIIKLFKPTSNWQTDWDACLKDFYQKEYKDLPEEIKSILTTRFVANIFSLLTTVKIAETNSSIFTIVKANTKQYLTGFDTIKIVQI